MELTKRSNFKIDVSNIATADVVIRKGLKPIDFIGVIVMAGPEAKTMVMITTAVETNGAVLFASGEAAFSYNPTTGKITVVESKPAGDNGQT